MESEVLVVGAGPTGLTSAIELTRRGCATSIIEQRSGISDRTSTVDFTPPSLELLESAGVTGKLLDNGHIINGLSIYADSSLELDLPLDQTKKRTPYKFLLAISHQQVERTLTNTLEKLGVSVNYNKRLIALNDTQGNVLATCSDGTSDVYRYVVGADGKHSTTGDLAGLQHTVYTTADKWSVSDITTDGWQSSHAYTLLLSKGVVAAVVPEEENRIKVIANCDNPIGLLPAGIKVLLVHQQYSVPISIKQANTYQKGNIFLAGDAAHCHYPITGCGVNLGIADAAALADCISQDDIIPYSTVRHPAGSQLIANAERTRKLLSSRNPLMHTAVKSTLRLCAKAPQMQRRLVDQFLL